MKRPDKVRPTEAIIYARFSPRPDADECDSLRYQEEICRRYCMSHKYGILEPIFHDEAKKGDDVTEEQRPGLWNALANLRKGMVLVAFREDRLSRSVYLSEYIRMVATKKKARVEVVQGGFNGTGPEAELVRTVIAAANRYAKLAGAARTQAMMLSRQRMGNRVSYRLPYGWESDPNSPPHKRSGIATRMRRCQSEMRVIEEMADMRQGGASFHSIARILNATGVPTRCGAKWSAFLVSLILRREGLDYSSNSPSRPSIVDDPNSIPTAACAWEGLPVLPASSESKAKTMTEAPGLGP